MKDHKTTQYIQLYSFPDMDEHFYFNKCCCNELMALKERHCVPNLKEVDTTLLRRELFRLADFLQPYFERGSPVSHEELMSKTRMSIKKRYERAFRNIKNNRMIIDDKCAMITAFIKFEKMSKRKLTGAPRLIQFRSFEYLYTLKSNLVVYSSKIKTIDDLYDGQRLSTYFTKTMDGPTCARTMYEAWTKFKNPVAICLDHSCFDGHISEEMLELEREYFGKILKSKELDYLLKKQQVNKGVTQSGLRYKVRGKRMSGEYNTSDGNSALNLAMYKALCLYLQILFQFIFVNGDDSVLMVEFEDWEKIKQLIVNDKLPWFHRFNMETKVDRVCFNFNQITYCQCSPIRVGGDWRLVRDPLRSMSRFCYAAKKYQNCASRYLAGSALCELAVNSGIPILQSFYLGILAENMVRPLGSIDKMPAILSRNEVELKEIDMTTRIDFEEAFGVPVGQQLDMEFNMAGFLSKDPNLLKFIQRYKKFHLN